MNEIDRDALREWARKRIEFYQQFDSDFAKGLIAGINELIENWGIEWEDETHE